MENNLIPIKTKEIALGTYEIENNYLTYLKEVKSIVKFDYVDTSICYNNDYYLSKVDFLRGKKLISKIPPQMTNDYEFYISNHLKSLKRDYIDIMLIHNPRCDWTELALKMINDKRFKEVGVSNFSIDDIKRYKLVTGSYPKYNEMEVNIDYYDKDLIEFCHKNDIKIISYAILGGKYNARKNISRYTLESLLIFVLGIADIVIIRSDVTRRLWVMSERINYLIENSVGINISYPEESRFQKSIEPMNYSIPSRQSIILTNSSNGSLPTYDNDLSIGYLARRRTSILIDEDNFKSFSKGGNINEIIIERLESLVPPSGLEFITDYRATYRYEIIRILSSLFPEDKGYYINIVPDPDILVIEIFKKRLFLKDKSIKLLWINVVLYDKVNKKLSKISNENTVLKLNYLLS